MKTLGKIFLPELNVNPINRDLLLVTLIGLLAAVAIGAVATMLISQ